ncbi:hypothetical protein [Labilibacter marinus]|uniref:hypothetical protein n=1 Tax=Labilibacter marinus TaxID=1477105 RepID=UPI00082C4F6B|nr:hypothetical protein [Labilibacter marinus]
MLVRIYYTVFAVVLLFSSCNKRDDLIITTVNMYNHYRLHGTNQNRGEFEIKYSVHNLNDSVIWLKVFEYCGLQERSIEVSKELGKEIYDTLDYQNYFLQLKGDSFIDSLIETNDEHFVLEMERDYLIDNDSLKVISFYRMHDDLDGDSRIYFSPRAGIIAEYAISNFHALISTRVNDIKLEKYRIALTEKMISDTTFFPIPSDRTKTFKN